MQISKHLTRSISIDEVVIFTCLHFIVVILTQPNCWFGSIQITRHPFLSQNMPNAPANKFYGSIDVPIQWPQLDEFMHVRLRVFTCTSIVSWSVRHSFWRTQSIFRSVDRCHSAETCPNTVFVAVLDARGEVREESLRTQSTTTSPDLPSTENPGLNCSLGVRRLNGSLIKKWVTSDTYEITDEYGLAKKHIAWQKYTEIYQISQAKCRLLTILGGDNKSRAEASWWFVFLLF